MLIVSPGGYTGPILSLDFMIPDSLDPRINFARASGAAYIDASGFIQMAGMNLALWSADLTNAAWIVSHVTTTTRISGAPDGTATVSRITEDAAVNSHYTIQSPTVLASTLYALSIYAKAAENRYLQLGFTDSTMANGGYATFDLQTGTITGALTARGTGAIGTADIQPAGNGFYRCAISATAGASTAGRIEVVLSNVANPPFRPVYAGNVANGLLAWGAQLELGTAPTFYIPTTTAAANAPRWDYDPVTHALRGVLIEEQRTNGVPNGNAAGAVVSGALPAGWVESQNTGIPPVVAGFGTESGIPYVDIRFVGTPVGGAQNNIFVANGTIVGGNNQAWMGSVYLRVVSGTLPTNAITVLCSDNTGNFDGLNYNPTSAPLATQRYTKPFTTQTTGVNSLSLLVQLNSTVGVPVNVTLRIGAAQMEQGAFPTSYIPTTSAAVTRAADQLSCSKTGWYVPPGGSWMVEFIRFNPSGGFFRIIQVDAGSGATQLYCDGSTGGIGQYDGGPMQTDTVNTGVNVIARATSTWAVGEAKICANGNAVNKMTGYINGYPGMNPEIIFQTAILAESMSGYIRALKYWPRTLSDTEMQQVTT